MDLHWVQPGPPEKRTGGFIYNNRIVTGLREAGHSVTLHQLSERFPAPTADDRAEAAAILSRLSDNSLVVFDGLAFGVLAEEVAPQADRLAITALCHHPLALEGDPNSPDAQRLKAAEQAALKSAVKIVTTSMTTVENLAGYDINPVTPIIPVLPGVDLAPLATGSGTSRLNLLCVASLTARKGHRFLIEALTALKHLDWKLICAGGAQHEPGTADAINKQIAVAGLANRVELVGELGSGALSDLYAQADLFVLPSLHEGYGMVLVEALARGLPIVSTTAGAIPEVVPKNAGILVEPSDPLALQDALRRIVEDRQIRSALADSAREARSNLRLWPIAFEEFAAAVFPQEHLGPDR